MSRTLARKLDPLQLRLLQLLRDRTGWTHVTDLMALFPRSRHLAVALALQGLRDAAYVTRSAAGNYRITPKAR